VLGDDEALGTALGELLRRNPRVRRAQGEVVRRQAELQRFVSDRAWKLYLVVEEMSVARLSDALDLVARWAFAAGRRFERRRTR
jgi:hypothetical protein